MSPDLKESWREFELEEFPETCHGRLADGMTWDQVDAVAAACISTYIATGPLDSECRALLDGAILRLAEMTAVVEEEHRSYFEKLLDFARQVRDASVSPTPG